MVYINENSKIVSFPKVSAESFDKIHFVNQVTKFGFDLFTTDTTNNSLVYNIDISPVIDKFEAGQYDYSFQKNDGTVISGGILQFEGFTPTNITYNHNTKFIQYTPDETAYPEANTTITITENDTYNVEDYDTAIVNVNSGGDLSIANIYTKGYSIHKITTPFGDSVNVSDKLYTDLYFTLSCDIKLAYGLKDSTYFTISRYNQLTKKYSVLNDIEMHDERLKMYCWAYKNDEDWQRTWTYFYTPINYNTVEELFHDDFFICITRCPNAREKNFGSSWFENNYATNLHQLMTDWSYVSDLFNYDEMPLITRVPKYDVDNYFVNAVTKNPITKWCEEWGYESESDIEDKGSKIDFIDWLNSKSITQRGKMESTDGSGDEYELYAYKTYCDDVPIRPVKLADCYVSVIGDLAKKYFDSHNEKWMRFGDLVEEDLELLKNPVFKSPYTGNEILARLYTQKDQWDYWYRCADWKNKLYSDYLHSANRRSGNKRMYEVQKDSSRGFQLYIRFGLCNSEQLKLGNYNSIPEYHTKLIARGASGYNYYDEYNDELINCMVIKIV